MRATEHADVEIRELAVECLRQLQRVAPNVFADFTITTLPDGTEIAASPYAWESLSPTGESAARRPLGCVA